MNAWSWKLSEDQNEDSLIKIFSILFESCSTFSVIQYPTLFTTVPRATTTSHSPLNFLPPCCMPIHSFSLNFSLSLSLPPTLLALINSSLGSRRFLASKKLATNFSSKWKKFRAEGVEWNHVFFLRFLTCSVQRNRIQ